MNEVVSSFLMHDGKILLMKRSNLVGSYKGYWGVAAGYIVTGLTALENAKKEILEETGLKENEIRLIKEGQPFVLEDEGKIWHIHPFLFEAKRADIAIDWEHTEYRWVKIEDFDKYKTVTKLKESLRRVLNLH
ncbi:NUDIX domain-containing protein [Candidatus Woesearchaeota archaeon]|nr:NUDIX domain-containing protein [Candidatus Woesearchaeota archaeon]